MTEQGGPEVLRLVDLPDPQPGPGQILIRVEAAAVNFSDVMRRRGDDYPVPTPSPFVPGAEVSGTVVALGENVDGPAVGTSVFAMVGADASGGYAELAVAFAPNVIPIPPGLEPDAAAGIVVAGLAATLILTETVGIEEGHSVFIPAAAGGVGGYAVQIAKLLGAGNVIAGASTEAKRKIALGFGADHAVDYSDPNWVKTVRDLTGGTGVDVALEMSGGDRLAQTLGLLAPFGRLVVFGSVSGVPGRLDENALLPWLYDPAPNQSVVGFNLGPWFELRLPAAVAALHRLIEWVGSGQVRVPVSRAFPLAEAAEAHRLLESGATTGKLVLKP
ncbi:zinc-binding dehydrogenase [Streptomyces sp. NPDC001982]|uniref:quinone oxidoreductase family protein n=1 Tax=Streptomyces sp. NPDC001982 TaxID=3154405 RepID=UPI003319F913